MPEMTATADQHATPLSGSMLAQRQTGLAGAFYMLRRAADLTAEELAERAGVPVDTVHAIERGEHVVDTELADLLMDAADAPERMRRRISNLLEFSQTPLFRRVSQREAERGGETAVETTAVWSWPTDTDEDSANGNTLARVFDDMLRQVDDGADTKVALDQAVGEYSRRRAPVKPREPGTLPTLVMVKPGWRRVVNTPQGDPVWWPDPAQITTEAELLAALQEIRASTGMSYGKLAELTKAQKRYQLSKSSLHAMCTKLAVTYTTEALASFLLACGAPDSDLDLWRAAWQRVRQNAVRSPKSAAAPSPSTDVREPGPETSEEMSAQAAADAVDAEHGDTVTPTASSLPAATTKTTMTVEQQLLELADTKGMQRDRQPPPTVKTTLKVVPDPETTPQPGGASTAHTTSPRSASRAPHKRRAKSWWDMLIEANATDPMRLARAASLVIVVLAAAIVLVAFGLYWISTLH